mmetsp:Transcript_156278/g.299622  ORF Transcript_156278/g.299622 Transcript_156278/m.299622 type:complete len:123 (-) Transcript_156278:208-576(-)
MPRGLVRVSLVLAVLISFHDGIGAIREQKETEVLAVSPSGGATRGSFENTSNSTASSLLESQLKVQDMACFNRVSTRNWGKIQSWGILALLIVLVSISLALLCAWRCMLLNEMRAASMMGTS